MNRPRREGYDSKHPARVDFSNHTSHYPGSDEWKRDPRFLGVLSVARRIGTQSK